MSSFPISYHKHRVYYCGRAILYVFMLDSFGMRNRENSQ